MEQTSLFTGPRKHAGGRGTAEFSDDAAYRYRLTRTIQQSAAPRSVLFIMLNPSSADGDQNDPTISRCEAFAQAWGFDELVVVNLFALVATDPRDLRDSLEAGCDVVGPGNDSHILAAARAAKLVVCAWGANAAVVDPARAGAVLAMLRQYGRTPHTIGLTAEGYPKHPLARGKHFVPASARPFPLPVGPELPATA